MAKNYVYVPGLAVYDLVRRKSVEERGLDQFTARVADLGDEFVSGAVEYLKGQKKASTIACDRWLTWQDVSSPKVRKVLGPAQPKSIGGQQVKVTRALGDLTDNLSPKQLGTAPAAPKPPVYKQKVGLGFCWVAEVLGLSLPEEALGAGSALKDVGKNDTLFLVGHGSPEGAAMRYRRKTSRICSDATCKKDHRVLMNIDAVTLATLLQDEGLSVRHKDIALAMCFGSGYEREDLQTVQPYAQRLAGALYARGYKSIRVTGVLGIAWGGEFRVSAEPEGIVEEQGVQKVEFDAFKRQDWASKERTFCGEPRKA